MTHPPQSGSAADTQKGNLPNTVTESSQGAAPVGRRSKPLRVGSLFAGYGGSELAVQSVFPDATPAWFVEYDKHPSTILAAHWPDVPNYGDVTTVDWDCVEPVDILTAGWPCQPFSHAGQRRGTDDDRHLWPYVADAVRVLRPRYLFGENVAGHLSLGFDTVLADLAGLGFDARWGVVRASDAGAPHRRARVFIVATAAAHTDESGPQGRGVIRSGRASERPTRTHSVGFGPYEAAIRRWEHTLGRPAPQPTVPTGRNGGHRLNPRLVEWMMGLPEGWVTDTGISHVAQLKALGNGIVWQQMALALRLLLAVAA